MAAGRGETDGGFLKKHIVRYLDEFAFRWKHRNVTDGERMVAAIDGAEGKRLMYRQPAGGNAGLVTAANS